MGRLGDKRKKTDTSGQDAAERRREQRRRLEQATRDGAGLGERNKGASRPERSTLDTALRGVEMGAQIAHHGIEAAAEGAGIGAVGAGAALFEVALAGREVVKAIGETHDAHQRESLALGTRHALSVMMADCNNPDSPHIRDGAAYNKADFGRRVESILGGDKARWLTTLGIENNRAPQQYDQARDAVVDAANSVLQRGRTAAERQQLLQAFTNAAAEAMAPQRRQWSQGAGGPPG
ncbi:MAG: hypothetical protein R6X16_06475 [Anaerolineae bacterium]